MTVEYCHATSNNWMVSTLFLSSSCRADAIHHGTNFLNTPTRIPTGLAKYTADIPWISMIKPSVNGLLYAYFMFMSSVGRPMSRERCGRSNMCWWQTYIFKKTRGASIHGSCRPQLERPPSIQVRWHFRTLNTRAGRITKLITYSILEVRRRLSRSW